MTRLLTGQRLEPFAVETLSHGPLSLPRPEGLVHLQFHRFAGCPICNLHVHEVAKRHAELLAAKLTTVVFFHSPAEAMRPFQGELPFAAVPDPERRFYARFGVEQSVLGALHPVATWRAMRGLFAVKSNPLKADGGTTGLPADFLLGPDGTLLELKYGAHAGDVWSVDEVLGLARKHTAPSVSVAAAS